MLEALGAQFSWSVLVGSGGVFVTQDGGDDAGVGRQAAQDNAEPNDANGAGEGEAPGKAVGLWRVAGSKGQQSAEIIHDELKEDFLAKEITPYGMRGIKAKVVLEEKERSFDTPAKVIKLFEIGQRAAIPGEIGDEEFVIARVKLKANKAKREMEDRGFIVRIDEIEATVRVELAAQLRREIPKRLVASGKEEFRIDIAFLAFSVSEMAKGRTLTSGAFDAKEEELVLQRDSRHGIKSVKAAVGNKKTRAGDRIAIDQGDAGIIFIHKGSRLNDSISIALFQQVKESDRMKLMIAAVFGIVRDKGIRVFIRGDVEVGTVAGEQMQAEFGFRERETFVKTIEQRKEEMVIELGALVNEGGRGRPGGQGLFWITEAEEAMDFTADRACLHGHHEQDQVLERKATVTGKVPTGMKDKIVRMFFHSVDSAKE